MAERAAVWYASTRPGVVAAVRAGWIALVNLFVSELRKQSRQWVVPRAARTAGFRQRAQCEAVATVSADQPRGVKPGDGRDEMR